MNKIIVKASGGITKGSRRWINNNNRANKYEKEGYKVTRNLHPNGAFFAEIGDRTSDKAHERELGLILAENGFSSTLDKEGNLKIRLKDGRTITMPSVDGTIEGFTHEIAALKGKPSAAKVADAIEHSYKPSKYGNAVQADVAMTITPKGSTYHREHINDGVKEHLRRIREGETQARPLVYLHIDETNREVYYRNVKA